ncbi:N-6 DNA methylase [Gallaecimonas kandeliae]|uniref:Eco57I restriction-modification methylase domain-containing protein n=1 Tax=Gallaecimonas kandeliae TaxID=3029055 RepID=UPI00264748E5|nr:N-6 DNA methylase [Gallaecimonas kandeliae]WKE65783.1 N-6 DNA methylase [Gallaecimonas kandeliae]
MSSHQDYLRAFSSHAQTLSRLNGKQRDPSSLIQEILECWSCSEEPLERGICESEVSWERAVTDFLTWLQTLDHENAAYWLGCLYAHLLPAEQRKHQAVYFTPPLLTEPVLWRIRNMAPKVLLGHIVDPACGGAAFLVPVLEVVLRLPALKAMSPEARMSHVEKHIHGADIDPHLIEITRRLLDRSMAKDIRVTGQFPQWDLRVEDGLNAFDDLNGKVDLVVSNPPYRKLIRTEIETLADQRLRSLCAGQFNLYGLFMGRALDLLRPGGHAGLVTPMSYLSGKTFSHLRSRLIAEAAVTDLALVHQKGGVFYGAEQDAVLTILHKGAKQGQARISAISKDGKSLSLGAVKIEDQDMPWVLPRRSEDLAVLQESSRWHLSLKDYGYSIRVGNLVNYRDPRPRHVERPPDKADIVPLLWDSHVRAGALRWTPIGTKERPSWVEVANGAQGVICRPAVLIQRVSSPEQSKRLVCAALSGAFIKEHRGFIAENHVIVLEAIDPKITPERLAQLLNHPTVDRLFSMRASSTNVSIYELQYLRLPDVSALTGFIGAAEVL